MEDRKRPIPYENDSARPLKKQATAPNGVSKSHVDDGPYWKDDLERFQKDAIHRQMLEYKREKNTLESQLKEMRKKARYHDDHLRAIDSWFKQLLDEVKIMAESDDDQDMDLESLPTSLLFADQVTFEEHLSARSKDIRTVISRLFGHTKTFTPEVIELQKRISQLLAAEKEHAAELQKSQAEKDEMEERLENAAARYMSAEKKIDRAKSTTVAKLEKQSLLGAIKRETEEPNSTKKDEDSVNGVADNGEDLAEMEAQLNKVSAASEKQRDQLEKLQDENSKLQSQITELQVKSTSITDEDYAKTELFKQFKLQHEDVVKRVNDMEARNAQLKEENQKFTSERTVFQAQLEAETKATISLKDSTIGSWESQLARIRSERDDHMSKRDVLQKTLDSDKSALKKLQDLLETLKEELNAVQLENKRLAEENDTADTMADDSLSAEDMRVKLTDLERKHGLLNSELSSMQSAYQKMSRLASQKVYDFASLEEKVQRLTAEKQKADQKFFAAMKSKETREGEVRTLKMQVAKSSDVVNALKESEAVARSLIVNCEKQLAEFKSALEIKTIEHRAVQLEKQIKDSEAARLTARVTELKQLLATKDAQLATSTSACRASEVEASELQASLRDTRRSLESWKSKSGQSVQYESLRQLCYCGICKKNLRDTAIKTCGHTFCHECVDERLTSRSRKCPNCGKSFGANDHMKITL